MRAITLHEPWASAIADGVKDVENRTWPLPKAYVGVPIAIHAGKKYDEEGRDELLASGLWRPPIGSPLGCVIALVVFDRTIINGWYELHDRPRSPWFSGPCGWPVRAVEKLPRVIPCRGAQGLWTVTERVAQEVEGARLRLLEKLTK